MLQARLLGAVGIVAVVGGVLAAQAPAPPAFEVASIKLNRSASGVVRPPSLTPGPNGTFNFTLTRVAYGNSFCRSTRSSPTK
jgi:hypothetical protein